MAEVVIEIAEKVKEIIANQLGVETKELNEQTSLINDLNADSLDVVEIVMELEDKLKINTLDEDVENLTTIGEIIRCIEDRVQKKKNKE